MAVSAIDRKTALIIIDLQKGIVGMPTVHDSKQIIENSALLAKVFRSNNLPVVLVNVTGGAPGRTETNFSGTRSDDWDELIPELDQQSSDILITKKTWGAFTSTELDKKLKDLGVTQVVLAGIATGAGVESTARSAHEHGYHVTLAIDAMTDRSEAIHENSVERIFPRLGETGTTKEIIKLVEKIKSK